MFPAFAEVDHMKLPTNEDFLAQAQNCVSGLNSYVEHLGKNPKNCPFIAKAKGKYHHEDLKVHCDLSLLTLVSRNLEF
jgi:hypothetical protein